ncbi:MAG TPA: 2Fe-2S iron-sulfur cluster-binding protein [Thermoanaerobaculia bacterium]|jgi:NADH-quinone oxidoreductase subunit G|nr:2Fe-2S iron-sulfur cluster-binding protein [Thermoanaerobaculia bacterium]
MPTVTIDDRLVEVPAGTTLIDAGLQIGVQIPHYCYHQRLSVVGQCRMCLVKVEGMGKLQAGCSTQVTKDGMVVRTDTPEVKEAQRAMMEFLLVNHPLDCPICDQAGECALQDYSFKHGMATSRARFEDKRTYPGRERIPLGPTVVLNMNRCIQCTRCVRFTAEVAKTGEIGFLQRGARAEIGTFPGRELDNDLATCVVDICPVGALTSTRFRFAERVWYLDKKPSLCTGCDVGCNVTLEHRRGQIKRYKPRFNADVNDYWMCDYGRSTFERYAELPRLLAPRQVKDGHAAAVSWDDALDAFHHRLRGRVEGAVVFLGSGFLSTEEAYLLGKLADHVGSPHRTLYVEPSKPYHIPNLHGGVTGVDAAPNRRGAELAGMASRDGSVSAASLLAQGAGDVGVLVVADSDFGKAAHDAETVALLRRARTLIVLGWADTPLAKAADLALPVATHAEKDGTFVNVQRRVQRFRQAFPSVGEALPMVEVLASVLRRLDPGWKARTAGEVFDVLAAELPAFAGLSWKGVPPTGVALEELEPAAVG